MKEARTLAIDLQRLFQPLTPLPLPDLTPNTQIRILSSPCLQVQEVRYCRPIWTLQIVLIARCVTAGTNPIHNKKAKKKVVEEDEDDKAFKAKMLAGMDTS